MEQRCFQKTFKKQSYTAPASTSPTRARCGTCDNRDAYDDTCVTFTGVARVRGVEVRVAARRQSKAPSVYPERAKKRESGGRSDTSKRLAVETLWGGEKITKKTVLKKTKAFHRPRLEALLRHASSTAVSPPSPTLSSRQAQRPTLRVSRCVHTRARAKPGETAVAGRFP